MLKILSGTNSVRNTRIIVATHYLIWSRRLAEQTLLLQAGRLSEHLDANIFHLTCSGRLALIRI